jgi:FAD/FMN-containing dehydrogenase
MYPLINIVIEGLAFPTIAASFGAGVFFKSPLYGLLTLLSIGTLCRLKQAVTGPSVKPAGTCSRKEHKERLEEAKKEAKKPGPLRMFKATASNTFRPQQIQTRAAASARLDLSRFVHVLEVNVKELWCDIEASATFETFVDGTLPHGVVPLVVPELRTITVGGAIVGIGIESSSFKHGFFHDGLLEADILLASGEVVTVKPEGEYADLFRAIPNSLGSFGYLLRLRVRVQKAERFVKLQKVWCSTPEALIGGLVKECNVKENDYVDGVAVSAKGGMVITARFVNSVPAGEKVQDYGVGKQYYPTLLKEGTEYLPTIGYIWRWDADWFWVSQVFPGLSFTWNRWLCGSAVLRSDCYKIFNDFMISKIVGPLGLNKNEELVIQDIDIPYEKSAEWIHKFLKVVPSVRIGKIKLRIPGDKESSVPMWLCPVVGTKFPLMPQEPGKIYMNFGFWDTLTGPETQGGMTTARVNRALEALCTELGGRKTLYSSTFYSEEEFFDLYNGKIYKQAKAKYDPDTRLRGWYERLTKA